jgi:hypothetical protein
MMFEKKKKTIMTVALNLQKEFLKHHQFISNFKQ